MQPVSNDPNNVAPQEPVCDGCGLPRHEWKGGPDQQGVERGEEQFCCDGCADELGCTCARTSLEIHEKFAAWEQE